MSLPAPSELDRAALLRILPYGDEFLFVDSVDRLEEELIQAHYRIPDQLPALRAHFRDVAIMPGVLVGEGVAQAGSLLVRHRLSGHESKHLLAMKIDRGQFKSPAFPGQTLVYEVRLDALGPRLARLEGCAKVEGREVFSARIALAIMAKEQLREIASGAN